MRILLVEDDSIISKNIQTFLNKKGLVTDIAASLEKGYQKLSDEEYDCLVLDRGLPDGDGLELINRIREDGIILPILVLTSRNQDVDIIAGLNSGADDYLSKPFDMNILAARLKALMRRGNKLPSKPVINISDLVIDTNNAMVKRGPKKVNLSPREYALLEYMAIHSSKVIDRLTLLSHVWDEDTDIFSNTVDVHIKYLRNKIDKGFNKKLIKTVRGKGYILCAD